MHTDPVALAEPMRQTLGIGLVLGALFFGLVVAMVKIDSDNTIAWSSVATIGALSLTWMVLTKWAGRCCSSPSPPPEHRRSS